MRYFICIGTVYDTSARENIPARKLGISEEQRDILLLFAEKRIDEKCNPIYKIGPCEFTIQPDFSDIFK